MSDFFDKYLNIPKMMEEKRKYKLQMERVNAFPEDYRFVFEKIQHYIWMHVRGDGMDMLKVHYDLVDLFAEGVANNMPVLAITGDDVAGFCDELIRNTQSYTEKWRQNLNADIQKRLRKGKK
jgi:DNA-binding ferritin-like protein (Dps family)